MAKRQPRPRIEIARIESQPDATFGSVFSAVMLTLGLLVLVFTLGNETSAIREAAEAALWTGWNVMWGAVLVSSRRPVLIVTREKPPEVEGDEA